MAQATDIKQVKLGGNNKATDSTIIAFTSVGEQVEVIVTKRTTGNVRFTIQDATASPTVSGVALPLDKDVFVRLGQSQRLSLVTDESADVQMVDVIIQPVANPPQLQGILDALDMTEPGPVCPPLSVPRFRKKRNR